MNPIVSLTASALSTETKDTRAVAALEAIRAGKWRGPVEAIRAEYAATGKEGVQELKRQLPGILWSGKFDRRANAGLVAHSGLLCADLDNLADRLPEIRERLTTSLHLFALFLSPTATGLKAVFRVPADVSQHPASFRAVQAHVRELAGVEIDPACKDVCRLCFVSDDPDAWLNRDAAELPPLAVAAPEPSARRAPAGSDTLSPTAARLIQDGAEQGQRNPACLRLCCQLRDSGLGAAEAERHVLAFAARCQPPFPESEALATLRSAYSRPPREPARSVSAPRLRIGNSAYEYPPAATPSATTSTPSPDEAAFVRLAALSPADYDRQREAEAGRLGIRVATLDAEVARRRPAIATNLQGGSVDFPAVDPWPQPVNGAELLSAVADTFCRYVVLPPRAGDALALWTAHAHAFEAFVHSPRLNLCSPEKGCGKTLVLDVAASLVPRPLRTESITPAVLFRLVETHKPVLLLDEIDTYLHDADELRGLLNAGHKRGAKAYRCEGDHNEVRGFNAYAPAVLAGIGTLPGTLHDRSIIVRLARAKPGEVTARFDSRRTAVENDLCRQLARWTDDNLTRLESCDPALPGNAFNRLADNWRPLFAIAHVAGGDWPARAAAAFTALTTGDDLDAHGIGAALLADIRTIFAAASTDRLGFTDLAKGLAAMDGKPWPEFGKAGKPISVNQISRLLRRFDIRSHTIRFGDDTAKGYYVTDFADAFARYLPLLPLSASNKVTDPVNIGDSSLSGESHPRNVLPDENANSVNKDAGCDRVTRQKGVSPDPYTWPDGSPVAEAPEDLPPCDADGQRILPGDLETVEV